MSDNGQWEALTSAGITAYEAKDRAHFTLGMLAAQVEKDYGSDALGKYAAAINAEKARLAEYRTVWTFYRYSAVADFYDTYPGLRYTHWRDAMRLKDRDAALAFLAEASDNDWLVEAARAELDKRAGKQPPGHKVAEFECVFEGGYQYLADIREPKKFHVEFTVSADQYNALDMTHDARYLIRVYTLPEAQAA